MGQQLDQLAVPVLGWIVFAARTIGIIFAQLIAITMDLVNVPYVVVGTVVELDDVSSSESGSTYGILLDVNVPAARLAGARAISFRGDHSTPKRDPAGWVFMTAKLRRMVETGDKAAFVVAPGNGHAFSRLALIDREERVKNPETASHPKQGS